HQIAFGVLSARPSLGGLFFKQARKSIQAYIFARSKIVIIR
ncbi:MAG: hypothetical protein PWR12_1740, partial [Eubacteriaceae bacterium]|nr:hypothetical protein [Eubacteriaceae bacterium]